MPRLASLTVIGPMVWLAVLNSAPAQDKSAPSAPKPDTTRGPVEQHVMVNVKLVEVAHDKLRGPDWELGSSGIIGLMSKSAKPEAGKSSLVITVADTAKVQNLYKKLDAAGALKVLAEPSLLTVSGRPSWFASGTDVPILKRDGEGVITVEYKHIGIRLEVLPTCLKGQRLRLELRPSLTSLDDPRRILHKMSPLKPPKLRVQELQTSVELTAGQTIAVGFGHEKRATAGDCECVAIVTPSLVDPSEVSMSAREPAADKPETSPAGDGRK